MRHVRVLRQAILAAAITLSISSLAFSQAQTGSLSGTVSDQSGAPLAGAAVGAKEDRTGVAVHTVTSEAGIYVFPNVPPGIWTITAEKPGFKRSVQNGIEIFIAQRQTLDLRLEVGDVKQSVEVTATQSLLETETSESGQALTPKMYQTLPLWSGGLQNPSAFLGLYGGRQYGIGNEHRRLYRPRARATDRWHQQRDPRVGRHGLQSAFGRSFQRIQAAGRHLHRRIRAHRRRNRDPHHEDPAPTSYHGTWAYNMRRDIWEAAGWSVNQNRANPPGFRPKDRLNDTGGGVGGPVWIPKVYNGRNKTFFYFSNDNDLRPVAPATIVNTVPTTARDPGQLQPDSASHLRSRPAPSAPAPPPPATPFPNNIIPTSRFSKISANIIPSIPAPTGAALSNNHAFVNTSQVTDHVWALQDRSHFQRKEPHRLLPVAG